MNMWAQTVAVTSNTARGKGKGKIIFMPLAYCDRSTTASYMRINSELVGSSTIIHTRGYRTAYQEYKTGSPGVQETT
jgi:hypothetical protein